jgi:glycogen debranching enzyme
MTARPAAGQPFEPDVRIVEAPAAHERRRHTLKGGDTFLVCDHFGDMAAEPGKPEGLYHHDMRHLSHLALRVCGAPALPLSADLRDDNLLLAIDLTNPGITREAAPRLPPDVLHISRTRFLRNGMLFERIALRNFDRTAHDVEVDLAFAADFLDLFEVRGTPRERRGTSRVDRVGTDMVVLAYTGLDDVTRRTRLLFRPAPAILTASLSRHTLRLAGGDTMPIFLTVGCEEDGQSEDWPSAHRLFFTAYRDIGRDRRRTLSRAARVATSSPPLNETFDRALADVAMLTSETPDGPYPYAGIPWFSTVFGRDGIITALEMLWLDPALARGVLMFLARHQATATDPATDAQPGKILHEMRHCEMARLGEVPFGLYYGSVDATPLFVILAGLYWERTGDRAVLDSLWPHILAALNWMKEFGDIDGDGFVEYAGRSDRGLANQGWKDSEDSVFHADGTLARGPIALVEVQAYVFAAQRFAARMARVIGDLALARRLKVEAQALATRFDHAFWCEDIATYALALDGEKQPCKVISSNAGHALFAGIATPARARAVARALFTRDAFSGWGVRTVAASAARYNPLSYHDGSVWPHDNALICLGLARYGLHDEVLRVFTSMMEAATRMEGSRLPELFCGFRRRPGQAPVRYPVACTPQAWAAAAPFAMLQACLGLELDRGRGQIRFNAPRVPAAMGEVVLRGLELGEASVDVLLRRHGRDVAVNVISRTGAVEVVVTLS